MARAADILRSPFSFLFTRSRKEEVVAEYVIREHHQGRTLAEILEDAYVTNRLSPAQAERLLDRADVLNAVGADMVTAHRAAQAGAGAP
jgi:hypothetical protein